MKISRAVFFQMIRFGIVGVMNTGVDALLYTLLLKSNPWFEEHFLMASFISFCIATLHSYLWNKHFTFRDKKQYHYKQLLNFYIMSSVALCVNQILLYMCTTTGFHPIGSKVIASLGASGVNFLMQKFGTFRSRNT